ncbi:MAG TPA: hypothetical protein VEJ63_20170 [Planctomycetota bacterium]|nr:hypothetical protein [Planctomycetota bacterium]
MPLTISYYVHAWQAFLMLIAGVISVLAAFAGYVQSGGGEELLRRALSSVGEVEYRDTIPDWRKGQVVFTDVRKKDFKIGDDEKAEFSGIMAKEVRLQLDLLPWPPTIKTITVKGMPETSIDVSEGFLQSGRLRQLSVPEKFPSIVFEDCDLNFRIGKLQPLKLTGCSGELKRGSTGETRGNFSLSRLNDKPFRFKLESLDDGRWVLTGDEIQINTREAISGQTDLFSDKLDPLSFLVRALFTAELGAEGMVSSLRIVVQPATDRQKFTCDGEVGYRNLKLKLPLPEQDAGQAVPYFLGQLIAAEGAGRESGWRWPRWMQVDQVRTGENGRVAFHMTDGVLNFSCDEGPGSAFVGSRKGREFPPLENLKGSVESDVDGKPRRITLRGFLGNQLDFETRIERNKDSSRVYELILEPRSGDSQRLVFGKPLWRFISRVHDFVSVKDASLPLANFEIEADARHFPIPEWLPPGMQDLSGHIYAKGQFTRANLLKLENLSLDDGGSIVYGGPDLRKATPQPGHFLPLWRSLRGIFGTDSAWTLQDLSIQGQAEVQFTPDLQWESTKLQNWTINSGQILHAGLTTDIGVARLQFSAQHKKSGESSEIEVAAGLPKLWEAKFAGKWSTPPSQPPSGTFTLTEKDVPLLLHPLRETLSGDAVSSDKRRVNRTTTARVKDEGKPELEVRP